MTTRKWVVGKEARSCGEYSCASRDGKKAPSKFSLDEQSGLARFGCGVCGKTTERQLRDWKERRACKLCCYVRNVTVHKFSSDSKEYAREYCDACDALKSAWSHTYTAQKLSKQAQVKYGARGVDVPTIEQYRRILDSDSP